MPDSAIRKYAWIAVVLVGVIGVGTMVVVDTWMPGQEVVGMVVGLALLGASFVWAYLIDRERFWWAIIPGLSMFTLIAAIAADLLVGTDPTNDWASVLAVGVGAAVIGVVLKRADAKMTLFVIAAFSTGISIAMSPATVPVKAFLIVVDIAVSCLVVYGVNHGRPMISSHGWLHPHT